MKKLLSFIIFCTLLLAAVSLSAQIEFVLTINQATTNQIGGILTATNHGSQTFEYTFGGDPWCAIGVDGIIHSWGQWTIIVPVSIAPGATITRPIHWMDDYSSELTVGIHTLQAYIDWGQEYGIQAVGTPVEMPIGFDNPQPIDWNLLVDSADPNGINMRMAVTNTGSSNWHYNFIYSPFLHYSIDGNIIQHSVVQDPTDLILEANETRYFTLIYDGQLSPGEHTIQPYLRVQGWQPLIPVGEAVNFVVNDVYAQDVGSGEERARVPLDFYWRNSLYECIYSNEDLGGIAGEMTALAFYNDFPVNATFGNQNIKLFVQSTTREDLSEGWIPGTDMILAYDGTAVFDPGQNQIRIDFTEPITLHSGRNLAIMVERVWTLSYQMQAVPFMAQFSPVGMARRHYSDVSDLDGFAPPTASDSQLFNYSPRITIFYIPAPVANDDPYAPSHQPLMLRNYPNPFNPETRISFQLAEQNSLSLDIYNHRGQKVRGLLNDSLPAGEHSLIWDGKDDAGESQASGIYYLKLITGGRTALKKMMLLK